MKMERKFYFDYDQNKWSQRNSTFARQQGSKLRTILYAIANKKMFMRHNETIFMETFDEYEEQADDDSNAAITAFDTFSSL